MQLSPSGKRLATTVPAPNGRRALAVVDLTDATKSKIVAAYMDADIWGAQWVNDERLVFSIMDDREALAQQRGVGLFAVDASGKDAPRVLIRPSWQSISESTNIKSRALQPDHRLYRLVRDGSDDVVVAQQLYDAARQPIGIYVLRMDTNTGLTTSMSQGAPEHAYAWALDQRGRPRLVVTDQQGQTALYWKATDEARWIKIDEAPTFSERGIAWPLYVDPDNRIYASANVAPHADVTSLVSIRLSAEGAAPTVEPLLTAPGFDFAGTLVRNRSGRVMGITYTTEARGTHWLDETMKAAQQKVDALLPNTNNLLDCGDCEKDQNMLVTSFSDRQPDTYRLFRAATGKLETIGSSRPWIKPQSMAVRDMLRIPARDGLSFPVHVTRPNGVKGPAPMVVLVHGGPWLRGGAWAWDADSQFLASRGYVVVEPEFRGSYGYGYKLFRAGWKQWGLAMQDDVADAASWAIKQGIADPKRICIAGASYGGYATLMGLIRNPEIFRCGVEWVGVSDIDLMYSITWSDFSTDWKQYGMPTLVGDREKDAAQLAATSPIKLANKITQPLFMAYGGVDKRVPIDHGMKMRDALRKTNNQVEWKVYAEEGHGWLLPANEIDFWNRVEVFLDKNLKNAP